MDRSYFFVIAASQDEAKVGLKLWVCKTVYPCVIMYSSLYYFPYEKL